MSKSTDECFELFFNLPVMRGRVLVVSLLMILAACQPYVSDTVPSQQTDKPISRTATAHPTISPTKPVRSSPTVASSPTPQPVTLVVPARWSGITLEAIDQLSKDNELWVWQLKIREDPAAELAQGKADVSLVSGDEGIPAGQRPLALVVPFTSDWETISLIEAKQIQTMGSPFVAVMDWADTPGTHRALRVDGLHPSDPDYPLQQPWSLVAAPGYEAAATELVPALEALLEDDPLVHLAAVGDVMLDRALGEAIRAGDLTYPFAEITSRLMLADVTVGNLESALGDQGAPVNKGYTFRAPPEAAQTLSMAGFDLLSLANNHALDYGPQALQQGMDLLHQQDIATVGAGPDQASAHQPYIRQVNGLTLAFLAYVHVPVEVRGFNTQTWTATANHPGLAWADPAQIQADVSDACQQADLVIVLLHSGYESVPEPSPPQIAAAHAAIDAGANLVIGHHAHVLQGIEFYRDGVIAYGLGNFAFEDAGPPESAILNVWLDSDGVRQLEFMPVILEPDGHPRPAIEAEAVVIRQQIYDLTEMLNHR